MSQQSRKDGRERLQLSQLARGARWARRVAETGKSIPIQDESGQEIAWLVPAYEEVTDELLDRLIEIGAWPAHLIEVHVRPDIVKYGCRYHRPGNAFIWGRHALGLPVSKRQPPELTGDENGTA